MSDRQWHSCGEHEPDHRFLSYQAAHERAERLISHGWRQRFCTECRLWQWPKPQQWCERDGEVKS